MRKELEDLSVAQASVFSALITKLSELSQHKSCRATSIITQDPVVYTGPAKVADNLTVPLLANSVYRYKAFLRFISSATGSGWNIKYNAPLDTLVSGQWVNETSSSTKANYRFSDQYHFRKPAYVTNERVSYRPNPSLTARSYSCHK